MKKHKILLSVLYVFIASIIAYAGEKIYIYNSNIIDIEKYIVRHQTASKPTDALYPIHNENEGGFLFLDENGNKVFTLKNSDKYRYVFGKYNDGHMILAVEPKNNESIMTKDSDEYRLINAFIVDTKGNFVKIPFKINIYMSLEWSDEYYIPMFMNGHVPLQVGYNDYTVVDTKGNVVKKIKSKYLPDNYSEVLVFKPDEEPKPIEWSKDYMKYTDKNGNIILSLNTYFPACEAPDVDFNFYRGIAMVFFSDTNTCMRDYGFINADGKPINDEIYEYAEAFYDKNLTVVCTKTECGLINRQGKWVYKQSLKETRSEMPTDD